MLKLGELGEVSFRIYKSGELGDVSFGIYKLEVIFASFMGKNIQEKPRYRLHSNTIVVVESPRSAPFMVKKCPRKTLI